MHVVDLHRVGRRGPRFMVSAVCVSFAAMVPAIAQAQPGSSSDSIARAHATAVAQAQPGSSSDSIARAHATAVAQAQPGPSSDSIARAHAAYDAGAKAFSEQRYADAGLRFDEAARVLPNPVALVTGATAWERAGRPAQAADDYAAALAMGGLDEKPAHKAKERLAVLEAGLARVHVVGPQGFRVQVDDEASPASVPATLHGTPGTHVLIVTPSGDGPRVSTDRRTVILAVGHPLEVDVSPVAPVASTAGASGSGLLASGDSTAGTTRGSTLDGNIASAPAGSPTSGAESTRRTTGYALLAAGAAAEIAAAALWWGAALPADDDFNRNKTASNRSNVEGLEMWTHVALVGGAALLVGGAVCTLWPSAAPSVGSAHAAAQSVLTLRVGPGNLQLGGTW